MFSDFKNTNKIIINNVNVTQEGGGANPEEPEEPSGTDLLPNISSGQWTIHQSAAVTGTDELTLHADGVWKNTSISIEIRPNTTYHFTAENPNNGTIYAFEVDGSSVQTFIFISTNEAVDLTFTTKSSTQSLILALSSGESPSGTFIFKNPTLVLEEKPEEPGGTDLLPNISSGQWTIHQSAAVTGTDELTLHADGVWKNTSVSIEIEPNTTYHFTAENPNNGTIYAFEVDDSSVQTFVFISTNEAVDLTFTTKSSTQSLILALSSGESPSGTFIFKNPTLVEEEPEEPINQDLKISSNGRFLVKADGTPFFYMADTGWSLFTRITKEEANMYLEDRKNKGFNVIQAVVVAQFTGITQPNVYGQLAVHNGDVNQPNETYYQHIDWVINKAAEKGIYIALLPVWASSEVTPNSGIFNPNYQNQGWTTATSKAYNHGYFLGNRYKNHSNIIWVLGGDTNPPGFESIYRSMAQGLHDGDNGRHLMTYHPQFMNNYFHNESWLDFNMAQTNHVFDSPNYNAMRTNYNLIPPKPTIDGEPRYEDIPHNYNTANPRITDFDVRQAQYWALFSGAFGIVYGNNNVWQMYEPQYPPWIGANIYWYNALNRPGAAQMIHIRKLIESRPFLTRIPDQSLIISGQRSDGGHIVSTRASDGSYAFVYSPYGGTFSINLNKLSGSTVKAYWYNPKNGVATEIGKLDKSGNRSFTAPNAGRGNDWVLVLDDTSKNYNTPGTL
ncbi:glycoside hydrolase family 140 protein [Peribacillus asahii]|uniref:glycoside hydrolase family 140 protein n=1 Tax=Peribacillus asahii TaxID=228899 RepID=UPI00207A60CA|nr:glycoside hydrolase family 140 protein [Peribacillus asahii]USK68318.1 glycoside hydrolase family 140 protein [Peribacillus asahii]